MKTKTCFRALYSFPGFQALARFKSGVTGDPHARVVALVRRQKKMSAGGEVGHFRLRQEATVEVCLAHAEEESPQ